MNYEAANKQLKSEILAYFAGQSKENLIKICKAIAADAEDGCSFDLLRNFAPRHHESIKGFVVRKSAIEAQWKDEQCGNDDSYGIDNAIGDIAKYLPQGANVSSFCLNRAAMDVVDGKVSARESALRLTSKKVLIRK
jgi:hypothetical protein